MESNLIKKILEKGTKGDMIFIEQIHPQNLELKIPSIRRLTYHPGFEIDNESFIEQLNGKYRLHFNLRNLRLPSVINFTFEEKYGITTPSAEFFNTAILSSIDIHPELISSLYLGYEHVRTAIDNMSLNSEYYLGIASQYDQLIRRHMKKRSKN